MSEMNYNEDRTTENDLASADPVQRVVMRLGEFFNPYSTEHMKAYEHLCKVGYWPEGFIPEYVEVPVLFVVEIQAMMSKAWLKAIKDGVILGVPSFDV